MFGFGKKSVDKEDSGKNFADQIFDAIKLKGFDNAVDGAGDLGNVLNGTAGEAGNVLQGTGDVLKNAGDNLLCALGSLSPFCGSTDANNSKTIGDGTTMSRSTSKPDNC